jgi:hypothetical protein
MVLKELYLLIPLNLSHLAGFRLVGDFRVPNEAYPQGIKSTFDLVTPGGILVTTGAERGFFTAAVSETGTFKE